MLEIEGYYERLVLSRVFLVLPLEIDFKEERIILKRPNYSKDSLLIRKST